MLQVNSSPQQQLKLIGRSQTNSKIRMLTHDLASPLTAIKLNLDMLAPAVKQRKEMMQKIYEGLDYIEEMIAQESSTKKIKHTRWFVSEVIDGVVKLNSTRLKTNRIKVIKKYFCDKSYDNVPASMFFRVINNLVNNAIDALVTSNNDTKCIWLAIRPADKGLVVVVRDNGTGINKVIERQLLKSQVGNKKHGHGLGLLSSMHIVKQYFKGNISFRKNDLAKSGAVFEVSMS